MKNTVTLRDFREAFADRTPGPLDRHRYYSVLVPLVERDGVVHLLYQLRSETLRRQPGEVGFPGGKVEAGETPLACAVRETVEELCIPRESIEVIGELDYIYSRGDFTMYAFLASIADTDFARAFNRAEVQDVFLVPVSFFLENEPEIYRYELAPKVGADFPYDKIQPKGAYKWRTSSESVPIYNCEGRAIWGLTGRITLHLINILKETVLTT
ncbi:MAG: CoA pyrophosphatase [Clostridiales Family XIII bacterium]|jgi:8-oxo-dGTP pyrophosphatase MutT (NUDIX family)|nr:CoA pyrophosphatase [Clostridiales Family XIII bacterium]